MCLFLYISQVSNLTAQNALRFDGVDDYAQLVSKTRNVTLNDGSVSIEIVFSTEEVKPDQILFSYIDTILDLKIGLHNGLVPFVSYNSNLFMSEQTTFESNSCSHLSIIFEGEHVHIYQNGNLSDQFNNGGEILIAPKDYGEYYLGASPTFDGANFFGEIEHFRIFPAVRTQAQIIDFLFTKMPVELGLYYMYHDLFSINSEMSRDPYYWDNLVYLGGVAQITSKMPLFVDETCMNEYVEEVDEISPESIDPFCSALMNPCNSTGLPVNELLCNGNFEQYCLLLNLSPMGWWNPSHAFSMGQ